MIVGGSIETIANIRKLNHSDQLSRCVCIVLNKDELLIRLQKQHRYDTIIAIGEFNGFNDISVILT
jgi:hypothetical protein